jgi:hypothetical protein
VNKHKVGDKVVIRRDSQRTPKWILRGLRLNTPRTIQVVFYNKRQQHTFYYFGCNGKSKIDISFVPFRAEQIKAWNKGEVGRPKEKREYKRTGARVKI